MMKLKSVWRRAFPAFGIYLAFAPFFYFLLGLAFLSEGTWSGVGLFFLYCLGFFIVMFVAPAGIYELLRMWSAKLWKKGKWLSVADRREIRFGPRSVSKVKA